MSNNLFPDNNSESSVQNCKDDEDSHRRSMKMKNQMENGTCVMYDPVGMDDYNFMKFRKRMTHSEIL